MNPPLSPRLLILFILSLDAGCSALSSSQGFRDQIKAQGQATQHVKGVTSTRNPALLTTILFAGGLVCGRILSLFTDGIPSPLLLIYLVLELALIPFAIVIYRLPDPPSEPL